MMADLEQLIASLRAHGMPSVRNILVTVFGDALRPYDAAVSVQSLTRLLGPLGVTERLVRTSLTRLADDDLVAVDRVGNRSFYRVTEGASALFDRAEDRIYLTSEREWDGRWTMAVIDANVGTSEQRAALRRQLVWLGLGAVAPNVMASPTATPEEVVAVVRDTGLRDAVLVTRSETVADAVLISDIELAQRVVPLAALADQYNEIIGWFEGFSEVSDMSPGDSFVARTLLIATYRRVVLADPRLPPPLVTAGWNGPTARSLVASVYGALWESSQMWINTISETPVGALAASGDHPVKNRFHQ